MLWVDTVLASFGLFFIFFTVRDLVYTALLPRSGSLSGRLTALLWRGALWLHWRARSHRALTVAGILLPLTTIVVWALLLWLGWSLVFLSGSPSVVFTQGGAPADAFSVIYFAGYAVITLGNGDMQPSAGSGKC